MKRKIITIDEDKCDGCGACIPDCPEGALQLIDGKARLVSDLFCDGLGACMGTCPQGAISIVEREAEPYDERKVMENISRQGRNTILAHLKHLYDHDEKGYLAEAVEFLEEKGIDTAGYGNGDGEKGRCPASDRLAGVIRSGSSVKNAGKSGVGSGFSSGPAPGPAAAPLAGGAIESELRQWPVQLKLLNPAASYFDDADLLIAADCSPFAYADFHRRYVRGRVVVMFCPKLDPYADEYIDKLAAIFTAHRIASITILRMEVPCCGGTTAMVRKALEKAGKKIDMEEITVSVDGRIL